MEPNDELQTVLKNLPESPGVYQFFDREDKIIYIGKAKSLKNRVNSYFHKKRFENAKLRILVRKTAKIEHILVESESDALLLENNLIKKYQPRYNVNLKDDKSFPWICVKNEPFPRVFSTRRLIRDGSKYYGPYTSAQTVRTLISLIRELYMLRNCNLNLTNENIKKGKFKVCLEYHLKNCKGPCEGNQSSESYDETIEQVHKILRGNLNEVIEYLRKLMKEYAAEYKFEQANSMKTKIDTLKKFQMKSTIVNPSIHDVDVFSIQDDVKYAYVNFLKIINGSITQAHTVEIKKKLDEPLQELLGYAILELRQRLHSQSREIILPLEINELPSEIKQTIPQKGDKKKLLDLSTRNAKYYMLDKRKKRKERSPLRSVERVLSTMKKDFRLPSLPYHIECFDNSNLQGSNPVAACVVFKNLKPVKSEYRHYNVKTVKGPDDFASMKEIVYRRYSRLLKESGDLPQMIVIDGGKGQLNAALKSLEKLKLRDKIAIIGIAKKLEEIYFPEDPIPVYLDKNSESLKIIQQLRNEAHRFGITFHRLKRSKQMTESRLAKINGIGEKTIQELISKYKSVDVIESKSVDELAKVIGRKKAILLKEKIDS